MKKLLCAIAMMSVIISAASCGGEPLESSAPPPSSSSASEVGNPDNETSAPRASLPPSPPPTEPPTEPDNHLQEKYDNLKQEYSKLYDYYRLFTVHIVNNMSDGAYTMDDFEDFFKTYEYLDNPSYEKAQQLIAKEEMTSDEASKTIYTDYRNLQNEYETLFNLYRMLLLDVGTKIGDDGYTMSEFNAYISEYGELIRSVEEVENLIK